MQRKIKLLILVVTIAVVISSVSLLNSSALETEETENELLMMPVDIESVEMVEAHSSLSYLVHKMEYPKSFENSDLVAVVEITPDVATYYKPFIHTLYKARVIQVIKGSAPDMIDIYQLDGYHPKSTRSRSGFFVYGDSDPLLKPGERWLFFMVTWDMTTPETWRWHVKAEDVPHGEVYVAGKMCLKLEEDGLYSIDNYNERWRRNFQSDGELSEEEKAMYGIQHLPSMYERFHVEGLTVEKFIKRISKKKYK